MPYDYVHCKVIEVHDGDTLKMDMDLGLNSHQHEWLRLVNCYAAELKVKPAGPDARDALAALCVMYKEFRVKTFPVGKDDNEERSFVRYIADVYFDPPLPDGINTLSKYMVKAGFATAVP